MAKTALGIATGSPAGLAVGAVGLRAAEDEAAASVRVTGAVKGEVSAAKETHSNLQQKTRDLRSSAHLQGLNLQSQGLQRKLQRSGLQNSELQNADLLSVEMQLQKLLQKAGLQQKVSLQQRARLYPGELQAEVQVQNELLKTANPLAGQTGICLCR